MSEQTPARGKRLIALALLALGVVLYIAFQGFGANARRHDNDFKHIYLGTLAILEGDSPYPPQSLLLQASRRGMRDVALNPYVYLPFTGLSLVFVQPLSFEAASQLWFLLNHAFLLSSLWLIAASLWPHSRTAAFGGLLVAMALNHPLTRTLTAGQLNLVLLVCVAGAYALLTRKREPAAGALLGYAAVFKLAPAAFGLFFLAARRGRGLVSMIVACLLLIGLSIGIAGWSMHADFLPMLRDMSYGRSTWQHIRADGGGATFWKDPPNQSINSLMTHLLVSENRITAPWFHLNQSAANGATWAGTLMLLGIYGWVAAGVGRETKDRLAAPSRPPTDGAPQKADFRRKFSLPEQGLFCATLLLSLLVPSLLWDHYLVALILPVAWLTRRYADTRRSGYLATLGVAYLLTCLPWNYFAPAFREGVGILLMSMKLFPALLLYLLVCLETRRTTRPGTKIAAGAQIG